jgi:hypothetical protein
MKKRILLAILSLISLMIIAYGSMYLFRQHIMGYHLAFLGMSEEKLTEFDSEIIPLCLALIRITGSCMVAIGAASLFIVLGPLRSGQRWASWLLMILLIFPLVITSVVTYNIASTISSGPRPPYWLAMGLLVVILIVIGLLGLSKNKERI